MYIIASVVLVLFFNLNCPVVPIPDEIHGAAASGDLEAVKSIIEKDPFQVTAKDELGRTPLHWAARGVHLEVMEYLLSKGAEVNATDNNGVMALHSVAVRGHVQAAALLLKNGADVNAADGTGQTPLLYAASAGHGALVDLLLESGVRVPLEGAEGANLLHLATSTGCEKLAVMMTDKGADLSSLNFYGGTLLHSAASGGSVKIVERLLTAGLEIDALDRQRMSPLHIAAAAGRGEVAALLRARGADAASKNRNGGSLLHSAAAGNLVDLMEKLITDGGDIQASNRYGMTPLHVAALGGADQSIEYLIAKGADVNQATPFGMTPLYFAGLAGRQETVDLLKSKGADRLFIDFPVLEGDYLGLPAPAAEPQLFAPGLVSSVMEEHGTLCVTPGCREMFWNISVAGSRQFQLYGIERENGRWAPPARPAFAHAPGSEGIPILSPNGSAVLYQSDRPLFEGENVNFYRHLIVERGSDGWLEPKIIDPVFEEGYTAIVAATRDDEYFFIRFMPGQPGGTNIYRTQKGEGGFSPPELLPAPIYTEADEMDLFVAPDGSYLIFGSNRPGGCGEMDLYITFRQPDGRWGEPINFGEGVNTSAIDRIATVTPDGKYLFFMSDRNGNQDIYWMDAGIIRELEERQQ